MIKKKYLLIYAFIALFGILFGLFFPKKTIKSILEKIVDTRLQALMPHDFVYAAAKIKPSVVGLVVTKVKVVDDHEQYSEYFSKYFAENGIPMPSFQTVYNMGSGIVIDTNGNILTSNHIVNGAEELTIAFPDGSTVGAVVIASDTLSDLAVIRADTLFSRPIPADFVSEDSLQVGEFVLAAGNPFLNFFNSADPTMTLGIVSALHRNFRFTGTGIYQDMIQTDAAINPGNSGGPLFNTRGEVCGINSFIYTGDESVQGSVGIGFAIPASRAYHIAQELITYGRRRVSWTGLKITDKGGIVITAVSSGGPGDIAGIEPGDHIVRIADRKIVKPSDIVGVFLPYFPGDTITFTVSRQGKEKVVKLILQEMP